MKTINEEREHFRDKLYEFQQLKNLSEYALSHELGKCDSYIQSISSGKNMPSFTAFIEICRVCNKEPYEFFLPEELDNETAKSCLHELKGVPQEQMAQVIEYLKQLKS